MSEFIFMLTHNDATVENARDILDEVVATGLRCIGFKDVGASRETLAEVTAHAHEADMTVMLEIVTTDAEEELRTLATAAEIGVDCVLGGTHPAEGAALLRETGIRYYPFPGMIQGHPSVLVGELDEIAEHARELSLIDGVHGVDLLAYRHETLDPIALTRAVVDAVDGPVIVAGSIATVDQIAAVAEAGAWGFTIGGAIFEGRLPGGPTIAGQVAAVLKASNGSSATIPS
jgi:hypothetical protein